SALPAISYLALDEEDRDDLYFLAGQQDQDYSRRYTRYVEGQGLTDYWTGSTVLINPQSLSDMLIDYPDAWVIVDRERLSEEWAYQGDIANTLMEETTPVFMAEGGVVVLKPLRHEHATQSQSWQWFFNSTP